MDAKAIYNYLIDISEALFQKTPVLFAYLYGSIASDQPHPFSDLDIGIFVDKVSPKRGLNIELELGLKIDGKLQAGIQSDVRIINFLPVLISGKIVTDGRLFYCINDEKRVDYETRIRSIYFDFQMFTLQYQKRYISQLSDSIT